MATDGVQDFAGMIPVRDNALLPGNASAFCRNAYLYSGALQGFRKSALVKTLTGIATRSVYRIPLSTVTKPDFIESLWLEFDDPYVAVLRSPVAEDQFERYYFFPSSEMLISPGPQYSPLADIQGNLPKLLLGVPAPEHPPAVSHVSGTLPEVRSYVYTWSTAYGEEGPPSPPKLHHGTSDGVWTIGVNQPFFADRQGRNLATTNIYRTVTDVNGNALYYRVASIPLAQGSFIDDLLSTDITSNLVLASETWTGPPADLQGVVAMANGILAGFSNKREIWFCEAYLPHAWPVGYVLTVDAPIVALGAVGSSLVVITEGSPWIASGVSPATMTIGKIAAREPCISRGSICPAGEGVYYASTNGLILINAMGTTNVTQTIMSKEKWLATGVYDFVASKYATAYLAFARDSHAINNGLLIDHVNPNVSFTWLSLDGPIRSVYNDELSGATFLVTDEEILEWNPEVSTGQIPYIWKTKDYRFPFAQNFVAGIVYFDIPNSLTITAPTSASRAVSQNQDFNPETQYLLIRGYADGRLVFVREIIASGEVFLLPSGFRATYWAFQLEGQVTVRTIKFGTSVKELQAV